MSVRDRMYTQFSLYPVDSPVAQVVDEIRTGKALAFIALQNGGEFTITTQQVLKRKLEALADEYGAEALRLKLADVVDLWKPQAPLSLESAEADRPVDPPRGEARPVLEQGKLVGVFTAPRREAFAGLSSMYGPRFALFEEARGGARPAAPARTCPNCHRTIDFFKPKRVGDRIERHCPECDAVIQASSNG